MKRAHQPPSKERVSLDFEIRAGLPGAFEAWDARGAWFDHVRAHGEELATLAVAVTDGDTHARATFIAKRFRALLAQAHASHAFRLGARLDLASPLPEVKLWPPVFAGEPLTGELGTHTTVPLDWYQRHTVAAWCRAFAYFFSGLSSTGAVAGLARRHLRKMLLAAISGLGPEPEPLDGAPVKATQPRRARR